jgi:hypothetical protein
MDYLIIHISIFINALGQLRCGDALRDVMHKPSFRRLRSGLSGSPSHCRPCLAFVVMSRAYNGPRVDITLFIAFGSHAFTLPAVFCW